jgi:sugar-specific transcriptional regulator TrmB
MSNEPVPKRFKPSYPEILFVTREKTFKLQSETLQRAKAFMPMLADSPAPKNMEITDDNHYIQMDLDCGIFDIAEKHQILSLTTINKLPPPSIVELVDNEIAVEAEMDAMAALSSQIPMGRTYD